MATKSKPNWKVLDPLLPVLEQEGWSLAQIAEDWGLSLAILEGHLTQEGPMSAPPKHDYPALIVEYDQRLARGESTKVIQAEFESRGIHVRTFLNRRSQWNKEHRSTPQVHHDTPKEHPSTPEPIEGGLDDKDTQEHPRTLPEADHTEVHPGTLEGHQEVMEDVYQSVPDAPHISTDEAFQGIPEHPSTPEAPDLWTVHPGTPEATERMPDKQDTQEHLDTPDDSDSAEEHPSTPEEHQEMSPTDSGVLSEYSGVPARQDYGISTPMGHQSTPTAEDWELWHTIKARWVEVEKMLADRQALLRTPSGTPGHTQKKTYVFDVRHIALIDRCAEDHRMDLKDVLYAALQEFFERRGYLTPE